MPLQTYLSMNKPCLYIHTPYPGKKIQQYSEHNVDSFKHIVYNFFTGISPLCFLLKY